MRKIVLTVLMALGGWTAGAQSFDFSDLEHRIGIDIRPAITTRHHEFFRGENASETPFSFSNSRHLQYSFRFPSGSRLREFCPTAYQGIGVASYTFDGHCEIGHPSALYILQGAQIARFRNDLTLDYEWNFGVTTGWKTDNLAVSTRMNAFINTALLLKWHPVPEWIFSVGADYSHFSNGDTTLPNVGVNTFGVRLSAVYSIEGMETDISPERRTHDVYDQSKRISLDVVMCGAWNSEVLTYMDKEYILDGKFGVIALHLNPLYRITDKVYAGPSVDIQYNEGINLADHVAGVNPITDEIRFYRPPLSEQLAAGLSLRGELKMPIFSINIGIGHHLRYNGKEIGGIYNVFALKTFITENLFLHTGLKINYTDSSNNLLLGLGWRIKDR